MSKMPPEHVMDEAEAFDDAEAAVARLVAIYTEGCDLLGEHFERFAGSTKNLEKADARYPAVWIDVAPGRDHARGGLWPMARCRKPAVIAPFSPIPSYFEVTTSNSFNCCSIIMKGRFGSAFHGARYP